MNERTTNSENEKKNIKILDMYQLIFTEVDNNVFYFYYGLTLKKKTYLLDMYLTCVCSYVCLEISTMPPYLFVFIDFIKFI